MPLSARTFLARRAFTDDPQTTFPKFTLTRHTKAVNALAISPQGTHLLSAGNDSRVVLWNLSSGEMMQELSIPSAGYISCIIWVRIADHDEDSFVFGASDGNIHLYQRSKDSPLFSFSSISIAHGGAIESLTWDPHHRRLATVGAGEVRVWKVALDHKSFVPLNTNIVKQPYVARSVHFLDDGNSVVVCYLESGYVFCYSVEPWDLKWQKKTNGRIGDSYLDGQQLLTSNLQDGVDNILVNIPLQITVARESDMVIVGGDNGFVRVFDYHSGALREKLDHGSEGDLVPAVTSFEGPEGCTIITGSASDGHNSIKVWTQVPRVEKIPIAANKESLASGLSRKQFVLLALLCVLVNVIMVYLPKYLPADLPLALHDVPLFTYLIPGSRD